MWNLNQYTLASMGAFRGPLRNAGPMCCETEYRLCSLSRSLLPSRQWQRVTLLRQPTGKLTARSVCYRLSTMPRFTNNEKTDMLLCYGECHRNSRESAMLYARRYPDRLHPVPMTFVNVDRTLRLHGSFQRPYRTAGRRVQQDEVDTLILAAVARNPHSGSRHIAQELGISHTRVLQGLKRHKYHPYHVSLHQALDGLDWMRRTEFCMTMQEKLTHDPDFLRYVLFTDESTFHRDGNVNLHNAHYWSDNNPHWMREVCHQRRWKTNVWCGIVADRILGPVFLPNLTGATYLAFLERQLPMLLEDLPVAIIARLHFQQDGASPHYDRRVRRLLNDMFPNVWMGRGGPIPWPARSPDLTPLDFFLWGYVKSKVYETEPASLDELQQRIRTSIAAIPPAMLRNVRLSMTHRFADCLSADGGHFEHLY